VAAITNRTELLMKQSVIKHKNWRISLFDFCNQENMQYLLREWHYEKNNERGITPENIGSASSLKVWWKCPLGHEYDMQISDRSKENGQCPFCAGRRLLEGFNDLASQYPDVALDWDYEKNDLPPNEVVQHSSKKAHWKCHVCGHKWSATIAKRTGPQPSGCPRCVNHGMSRADMCIYLAIQKYYSDAEYRKKLFGSEFDISVPSINLAIEYDGEYFHNNGVKQKKDDSKTQLTKENNIKFLRVKEVRNVDFDFSYNDGVLFINVNRNTNYKEISHQVLICLKEQFLIDIGTDVDDDIVQQAISQIKSQNYQNSLQNQFPEIAKEWHPTKNGNLKPEYLDSHAHVDAWWICLKCNNEYFKPVNRRTDIRPHQAGGCPYCSGQRRLVGFNDLETLFPGISKHWVKDKNDEIGIKIEKCSPSSTKYAYWKFDDEIKQMQIKSAVQKYQRGKK
jgi:DNA-directed RNA polymerase subunit RPC12/RpoP